MLSEKIRRLLKMNRRPESRQAFEVEINVALAKGYKVPPVNFDDGIFTQEQAIAACQKLGLKKDGLFFEIYTNYRSLPVGEGEELYTLDQIIEDADDGFHSDEYPEIGKRYLQFTSIEGEGSYFYDKETDAVYDVNWGEEADMISGKKQPWFNSFYEFLEWYYSDIEE